MPQGDKSAYTDKQKRQAAHIEESYREHGVSEDEAERRAWATVNEQTGGGRRSGSGRKGGEKHVSGTEEHKRRSEAAKKGWETRRRKRGA
jgi:plasmid stabilization system protein ParE